MHSRGFNQLIPGVPNVPISPADFAQFNVPNLASLTLAAPAWVGAWAYVQSQRCGYFAVPVGQGDIAGVGIAWKRDPTTSDPAWKQTADWYVSATGDDEAPGTLAQPLMTTQEIMQRWGSSGGRVSLPGGTVVHLLTSLSTPVNFYITFETPGSTLTVLASPSAVVNDTVASWSPLSHGVYGVSSPSPPILVLTTSATAAFAGTRLVFHGAGGDAYSVFGSSNPAWAPSGAKSCSATVPYRGFGSGSYSNPQPYLPLAGTPVEIQTLATFPEATFDIVGDMGPAVNPVLYLNGLSFVGNLSVQTHGNIYNSTGCAYLIAATQESNGDVSSGQVIAPRIACELRFFVPFCFGPYIQGQFGNQELHSVSEGYLHHALAEQVRPEFLGGVFKLWDAFQVFGATNNAVTMFSGSVVVVAKFFDAVAGISGTNNAASIRLMPNSSLQLQKTPAAIANLRTGGAGADVTVRSVAGDIALTWTQANPYNDGAFTGTLTLGAGGLFDQAVPFLDVARQKIVLQYRDAAVGAGVLSAPVAQRSLTLFRAKGAPADTTSTIDWVFSELGDQIYIGSRTVP